MHPSVAFDLQSNFHVNVISYVWKQILSTEGYHHEKIIFGQSYGLRCGTPKETYMAKIHHRNHGTPLSYLTGFG